MFGITVKEPPKKDRKTVQKKTGGAVELVGYSKSGELYYK